jgi:hypothetical protein
MGRGIHPGDNHENWSFFATFTAARDAARRRYGLQLEFDQKSRACREFCAYWSERSSPKLNQENRHIPMR